MHTFSVYNIYIYNYIYIYIYLKNGTGAMFAICNWKNPRESWPVGWRWTGCCSAFWMQVVTMIYDIYDKDMIRETHDQKKMSLSIKNWMGPNPNGPLSKQVAIELYSGLGPFSGSDRWRFAICVILSNQQDPLDSYLQDDTVEDVNVSQSILCLCLKRCQCEPYIFWKLHRHRCQLEDIILFYPYSFWFIKVSLQVAV